MKLNISSPPLDASLKFDQKRLNYFYNSQYLAASGLTFNCVWKINNRIFVIYEPILPMVCFKFLAKLWLLYKKFFKLGKSDFRNSHVYQQYTIKTVLLAPSVTVYGYKSIVLSRDKSPWAFYFQCFRCLEGELFAIARRRISFPDGAATKNRNTVKFLVYFLCTQFVVGLLPTTLKLKHL